MGSAAEELHPIVWVKTIWAVRVWGEGWYFVGVNEENEALISSDSPDWMGPEPSDFKDDDRDLVEKVLKQQYSDKEIRFEKRW